MYHIFIWIEQSNGYLFKHNFFFSQERFSPIYSNEKQKIEVDFNEKMLWLTFDIL